MQRRLSERRGAASRPRGPSEMGKLWLRPLRTGARGGTYGRARGTEMATGAAASTPTIAQRGGLGLSAALTHLSVGLAPGDARKPVLLAFPSPNSVHDRAPPPVWVGRRMIRGG